MAKREPSIRLPGHKDEGLGVGVALPRDLVRALDWLRCWGQRAAQHFGRTPREDRARARQLAEEVSASAQDDAMVLTHCSGALVLANRIEEADGLIERALALDPWNALGWNRRGWVSAYVGDCEGAWRELNMALHLMPFGPPQHTAFIGIGCSHFAAHRYDRAARWAQSGVEANPSSFWGERIVIAAMTRYRRCCSSSPGVDSQQLFAQRLVNAVRTSRRTIALRRT